MKNFLLTLCTIGGLQLSIASPLQAQSLTEQQQRELSEINTMLSANPMLINSMHQGLNNYLVQRTEKNAFLAENQDWLFNNSVHPVTGDANAAHQIIVFTDYDCPFCKRLEPELEKLIEKHPTIQVINILVPLRQQKPAGARTSSALLALDLWLSDKTQFGQAHQLLMKKSGLHTAESLRHISTSTGNDALLNASAESQQIVERNMAVFTGFGLHGTPAIMIGEQVIPGFVPYPKLLEIAEHEFSLR